jgi:hypothetical protein
MPASPAKCRSDDNYKYEVLFGQNSPPRTGHQGDTLRGALVRLPHAPIEWILLTTKPQRTLVSDSQAHRPSFPNEWIVPVQSQRSLIVLPQNFAVCKLGHDAAIPSWATAGNFFSITRTADELSVVCSQDSVPEGIHSERDWRCLRVAGAMPFSIVGVVAGLTAALAEAGTSVFVVSTFDTDYLLAKQKDWTTALDVLRRQGYTIRESS